MFKKQWVCRMCTSVFLSMSVCVGVLVALRLSVAFACALPHCESFLKEDPRPQRLCADAERKRTRNEESSKSNRGLGRLTAGPGAFFGDSGHRVELTAHRWVPPPTPYPTPPECVPVRFHLVFTCLSSRHRMSHRAHPVPSFCSSAEKRSWPWRDQREIEKSSVITLCSPSSVRLHSWTELLNRPRSHTGDSQPAKERHGFSWAPPNKSSHFHFKVRSAFITHVEASVSSLIHSESEYHITST